MNCAEFEAVCVEWMEGERTPEARAHLLACPRCRALVADLEAIRLAAPQLLEGIEPPATLWARIEAELAREGLLARRWTLRLAPLTSRWVLSAATAAALAGLALLALPRRPAAVPAGLPWLSHDQAELSHVDRQMRHVELEAARGSLPADPTVRDTLMRNLAALDQQIELCSRTLEEDPDNEITRSYLFDAYHQKSDLLTLMAERAAAGE